MMMSAVLVVASIVAIVTLLVIIVRLKSVGRPSKLTLGLVHGNKVALFVACVAKCDPI